METGELDGCWGPQTEFAAGQLAYLHERGELPPPWRDQPLSDLNPNHRPDEARLKAYYGDPRRGLGLLKNYDWMHVQAARP